MVQRCRPVVLCILDGFGWRPETENNAVAQARKPNFDALWAKYPHGFLDASEEHVGLPQGQMGNSEVGHMNIGAGRVVFQDLPMIDRAIAAGELARNPILQAHIAKLKVSGSTCHLLGLTSPGGVHAHQDHMLALAKIVSDAGVPVAFHVWLDGRDVPPQQAVESLPPLIAKMQSLPQVKLATLCGRYFAMDRDKRWERVQQAYDLLVDARGARVNDVVLALRESYAAGAGDEFVPSLAMPDYQGMKDGDGILCANFRADRAREILTALLDPVFDGFTRGRVVNFTAATGMVEYSSALNKLLTTLFPPKDIREGLGEIVSRAGLKQLRIAETEKYPHVTFFFNGGLETVYPGEERILVPSPKVATYDLQPEMSAAEVTAKVVTAVESGTFDLIVINYANCDMVGHSGILAAAIKAVEAVDAGIGALAAAVERQGGAMLITADHGNCEMMYDPETSGPHTAHTLNRVPMILLGAPKTTKGIADGRLADIAPTLLQLMGLPQPTVMDGKSVLR
ncbi:MAG: 2,3-bisphosphoglycerate-independent phosphoglycerate mutase [Alphaproteobacteria bacterium]|nr:2,3-bisphosphoglycerate-independent phosphoglycerate mutase [Alphaproteobacteria bacterium]